MKPTVITNRTDKRFPIADCNYQSIELEDFNGGCAKLSPPSFHTLSRDYFGTEEPKSFLGEAAIFGTMMLTALAPLISGVFAIIHLCRELGAI